MFGTETWQGLVNHKSCGFDLAQFRRRACGSRCCRRQKIPAARKNLPQEIRGKKKPRRFRRG
jgi:hypothetical protein